MRRPGGRVHAVNEQNSASGNRFTREQSPESRYVVSIWLQSRQIGLDDLHAHVSGNRMSHRALAHAVGPNELQKASCFSVLRSLRKCRQTLPGFTGHLESRQVDARSFQPAGTGQSRMNRVNSPQPVQNLLVQTESRVKQGRLRQLCIGYQTNQSVTNQGRISHKVTSAQDSSFG